MSYKTDLWAKTAGFDEAASVVRGLEELSVIAERHADPRYPACALCGQKCVTVDRWGLCSKITKAHQELRTKERLS
jgi:hypothetical protein